MARDRISESESRRPAYSSGLLMVITQEPTQSLACCALPEIEHSRRLEGFSQVRLAALVREVGDLYNPIAEDNRVILRVEAANEAIVHGDRDLLFEAAANLVDNAVKFTPEGGRVELNF